MKEMNKKGFSFVEVMIVVLIMSAVFGSGFLVFSTGQATWFTTDINIRLQESLRQSLEKVTMELRQSQIGQGTISDGAGPNNTDVIEFSIPITCEAGNSLIDVNGDVANWGAPLTWGCTDSTCMDADNDCGTVDYDSIEYRVDNSNRLVRRVLDPGNALIREDVFAYNISDFQITINANVITLDITAQQQTVGNRTLTGQSSADVYLRN